MWRFLTAFAELGSHSHSHIFLLIFYFTTNMIPHSLFFVNVQILCLRVRAFCFDSLLSRNNAPFD